MGKIRNITNIVFCLIGILFTVSLLHSQTRDIIGNILFLEPKTLSTTCTNGQIEVDSITGDVFVCKSGILIATGGGGVGGINHLSTDTFNLETTVGDWLAYADASATSPADGTGGAPTVTCTRSTTTPLRDTADFILTKDANDRRGEGCGATFDSDSADGGNVMRVSFDYRLESGAFDAAVSSTADSDITVWIYDTDSAALLNQIAPHNLLCDDTANSCSFVSEFQAPSGVDSFRLILHVASTNGSAYVMAFDNFIVGPSNLARGPPMSDFATCTGTFTPNGFGTVTSEVYKCRRVGDVLEVAFEFNTGTVAGSDASLDIPFALDSSKIPTSSDGSMVGYYYGRDDGLTLDVFSVASGAIFYDNSDTNTLFFAEESTNDVFVKNDGNEIGSNTSKFSGRFKIPISGWFSNTQMSTDAGTREIFVRATNNAGTSLTAAVTDIDFSTETADTHGAWSGTVFTAPETGNYTTCASGLLTAAVSSSLAIYKDTALYTIIGTDTSSDQKNGCIDVSLSAGETISIRLNANATLLDSATKHVITIKKTGPGQSIFASDVFSIAYNSDAGQAVTSGNAILYEDLDRETHSGTYNTATGVFTCPFTMKVQVVAGIRTGAVTSAINAGLSIRVTQAGSATTVKTSFVDTGETTASRVYSTFFTGTFECAAADTLTIAFLEGLGAVNLLTDGQYNYIEFNKVGDF